MNKKVLASFAVTAILTVGVATPAFASDYVVDGTPWDVNSEGNFGVDQAGSNQNTAPYAAYSGDEFALKVEVPTTPGSYFTLDCASAPTATVEDDNDQLVECNDPTDLLGGDLTWDADLKIFSGDYRGLVARLTYVLTNASASPLNLNLRFHADTEECDLGAGNIATSSGDLIASDADSWLLCNNDNRAVEGIVWGNQWATDVSNSASATNPTTCDACYIDNDGFTLGAGQTATLVFFLYSEGSTSHGASFGADDDTLISNITSYFDLDTLGSSRLWEGLTSADNWSVTAASSAEEPTLANTGLDVNALVLAAFALAGLGAVMIVRRRAKA
jgi:LPXTG-motif cell wall-anchored protein